MYVIFCINHIRFAPSSSVGSLSSRNVGPEINAALIRHVNGFIIGALVETYWLENMFTSVSPHWSHLHKAIP